MQMSPCHYLRWAEREVRRNLILGPCLPSPCQHRRAALVSLPPQREPRCEAVRSPLSPRSQVLTFLRSLASTEANPEKMFSACFSAPPRLRVKQHLSNSTRSRPRRNSRRAEREVRRNLILGPCLPSPCQHRNAPDQLRYPPRAVLVSLPPQREPSLRSRTISAVSAPPRLRVKQHLSNSTRSRPRRNSRRAEREVRRNLWVHVFPPPASIEMHQTNCGIRRALRWSAFHPSVSLRCEAVRSPLSPRSQVLTFLRSLASSEANPEKMFSPCFSAPPRLRVKQHLSNSTRSQPRRNSRRAEREVRRNLILGPCLPSPCQHRNAPDQLRYPPHAALVSLPPQREPRCEAVRSPLSPRSQVLTFLRSLASTETNPEKMFSACFSAPPRLRVKQHLSNSTRSRPRRNSRRLALSGRLRTAVARRIGKAWSANRQLQTFFPLHFNYLQIRKSEFLPPRCYPRIGGMHIPPQSRIAQTRYLLYGLPIPRLSRPFRRPGDRPVCVTKLPAIPATRSGKGTYPHTRNPPHSWVLRHNALGPRSQPRRPVAVASDGVPRPVKHPSTNSSHLSPAGFWYICLDSNIAFIKHVRKEGVW